VYNTNICGDTVSWPQSTFKAKAVMCERQLSIKQQGKIGGSAKEKVLLFI